MKPHAKQLLLKIVFVVFSLLLLFNLNLGINKKSVPAIQGSPARLIIPAINVNVAIESVGLTPKREVDVPKNAINAGWLKLGPRPGEKGNAVITGHFDKENGEAGVFANLDKLKKGDKIYIKDDKGTPIVFVVRESRTYDPGYADNVFRSSDSAHLNLITCNGVWDDAQKSYSKRLVVFSDIAR